MIKTMTYKEFLDITQKPYGSYYDGRWAYFSEVIKLVEEIQPNMVLELGPSMHPVVKESDIIIKPGDDKWGEPDKWGGSKYYYDAVVTPWPFEDKAYNLFIGLQVWEHLDNKQNLVFREAMRVSNHIILSFPYKWDCLNEGEQYRSHYMIDEEVIADWTMNLKPDKVISIPRTGKRASKGPRIIYYWNLARHNLTDKSNDV